MDWHDARTQDRLREAIDLVGSEESNFAAIFGFNIADVLPEQKAATELMDRLATKDESYNTGHQRAIGVVKEAAKEGFPQPETTAYQHL